MTAGRMLTTQEELPENMNIIGKMSNVNLEKYLEKRKKNQTFTNKCAVPFKLMANSSQFMSYDSSLFDKQEPESTSYGCKKCCQYSIYLVIILALFQFVILDSLSKYNTVKSHTFDKLRTNGLNYQM